MVAAALERAHGWPDGSVVILPVKTSGDRIQDRPLAEVGGKALWTKELDLALLAGETDCSVHSMKDVESERPATLVIAAMLERADVRDRLIGAESISQLPEGAVVGTSSPRRTAQLKRLRPDLRAVSIRGNIDTRLLANVLLRDLARSGRIARLRIRLQDRPGALFKVMKLFDEKQVNIIEIYHQRIFTTLPAKGLITDIECEARDREHLDSLVASLRDAGYMVTTVELA